MLDSKIEKKSKSGMEKCLEAYKNELKGLRSGRAHPALLDSIRVDYYGNSTALNQISSISVPDPRTLAITPWEKSMVSAVEKAIMESKLGLNPDTKGSVIYIHLPPLTEDRRKDLVKIVKSEAENARVSIRNVRRDSNTDVKKLLKDKEITEDEAHEAEGIIQKLTDTFVEKIEEMMDTKEKELMEV